MPAGFGIEPVNQRREEHERLSHAFAARIQSRGRNECPDPEQLFEAASGNLTRDQRMVLLDHVAQCADCTEAWRLAMELGARPAGLATESSASVSPGHRPAWRSAIAASVVLVAGVVGYLALPVRDEIPRYRDVAEARAPASLVTGSLPRDRFVLKWSPGPQGSSYSVRLSTADLVPLLVQQNIASPELFVPASALTQVKSGDQLLWQVEVRLANGQQIPSETYVVTLQ
jgi:hypothetical protein